MQYTVYFVLIYHPIHLKVIQIKISETETLGYFYLPLVRDRKYKHFAEEQPFFPFNGDHIILGSDYSTDNYYIRVSFHTIIVTFNYPLSVPYVH